MKSVSTTFKAALLALPALLAGPVGAQETAELDADVVEAESASVQTASPALWKVADEDTTIYLFGTVHALPSDVNWYSSTIANALASSDSIVTEIEVGGQTSGQMQQLVNERGVLSPGSSLRGLLDEDQAAIYDLALGKLGVPAQAFDRFEPWYVGMLMSMLPLLQQGYSPEDGVEKVLIGRAGDKQQLALETVEFQIGVFDQLPIESQVRFLVDSAAAIDQIKPLLDQMVEEWAEGDAEELARLMNEGLTDPALAEALLYSRNRTWAEWIDERLETPGTVFIAVGAGHLAGKDSVQDALEDHDIQAVRIQ